MKWIIQHKTLNLTQPQQQQVNDGKKFTQEDLNRINIKGKNDELKRILKQQDLKLKKHLFNHLAKVKRL